MLIQPLSVFVCLSSTWKTENTSSFLSNVRYAEVQTQVLSSCSSFIDTCHHCHLWSEIGDKVKTTDYLFRLRLLLTLLFSVTIFTYSVQKSSQRTSGKKFRFERPRNTSLHDFEKRRMKTSFWNCWLNRWICSLKGHENSMRWLAQIEGFRFHVWGQTVHNFDLHS